jgi:endonuclease G
MNPADVLTPGPVVKGAVCIYGPGEHQKVGPNKDIWVPAMFYNIVVIENPGSELPHVLAFLLPHQYSAHGRIENFLVPVDIIEAMSGEDFFNNLDADVEKSLEAKDTWETWTRFGE